MSIAQKQTAVNQDSLFIKPLLSLPLEDNLTQSMGFSTEQWRITIGCFSQPFKSIDRLKTIKMGYTVLISLSVQTLMFILLVVQGVEANPGPPRGRGRI